MCPTEIRVPFDLGLELLPSFHFQPYNWLPLAREWFCWSHNSLGLLGSISFGVSKRDTTPFDNSQVLLRCIWWCMIQKRSQQNHLRAIQNKLESMHKHYSYLHAWSITAFVQFLLLCSTAEKAQSTSLYARFGPCKLRCLHVGHVVRSGCNIRWVVATLGLSSSKYATPIWWFPCSSPFHFRSKILRSLRVFLNRTRL